MSMASPQWHQHRAVTGGSGSPEVRVDQLRMGCAPAYGAPVCIALAIPSLLESCSRIAIYLSDSGRRQAADRERGARLERPVAVARARYNRATAARDEPCHPHLRFLPPALTLTSPRLLSVRACTLERASPVADADVRGPARQRPLPSHVPPHAHTHVPSRPRSQRTMCGIFAYCSFLKEKVSARFLSRHDASDGRRARVHGRVAESRCGRWQR
jgi:hypothetical protein